MSPRGPQCVACSGTRRRPSRGLIDAIRRSHGEQVWPVRGHRDCTNLLRGNDVGRLPRFHCSQVRDESEISCRRRISHSPQTLATSSFPHLAKSAPCQSITEAFSQSIRKHSAHTRSGGRWNIGVNSRTAECEGSPDCRHPRIPLPGTRPLLALCLSPRFSRNCRRALGDIRCQDRASISARV
jgi:hypothetical protein